MISVIIPVYNASSSLRKCVDSLLNQSYTDYELILVDDGSEDDSLSICYEYSSKFKSIRVIHQKNCGVSSARNLGLKNVTGEWVTFVDSDDWLERDYLESMIVPLSFQESDLVVSGFIVERNAVAEQYSFSDCLFQINKRDAHTFHSIFQTRLLYGPCCKLYKTSIIRIHEVCFPEDVSYGEDRLFNYKYLSCIDTILVCSEAKYHYIQSNPDSLSSKKRNNLFELEYSQWKCRWNLYVSRDMMTDQAENDLLIELFWCINDNLVQSKSLPFTEALSYTRRLLSIPEIDLIYQKRTFIKHNKLFTQSILNRNVILTTLLFRL